MYLITYGRIFLQKIIAKIRSLPGNDRCCDCGAADPEWLSVNLGILTCINCSGRHRELSVQYSRIRSLTLDQIKTTELLVGPCLTPRPSFIFLLSLSQIALVMGNGLLNEVLEANLTDPKPSPDTPLYAPRLCSLRLPLYLLLATGTSGKSLSAASTSRKSTLSPPLGRKHFSRNFTRLWILVTSNSCYRWAGLAVGRTLCSAGNELLPL